MRDMKPFLKNVGRFAVKRAVERVTKRLKSSGELAGSLTVFGIGKQSVEFGSNKPYAAIQNYGGTVRPKTVKLLAIPLDAKLKRGGLWPRDIDPARKLLSLVPVFGGRKGNIRFLLVDTEGLFGAKGKALYALATHVVIPGVHYIELTPQDVTVITKTLWPTYLGEA